MAAQKIEKKMRESEAENEKRGRAESSPPPPPKKKKKIIAELNDVHLLQTEAYICSEKGKLQNNMKQQNYNEGRKEKNQNGVV